MRDVHLLVDLEFCREALLAMEDFHPDVVALLDQCILDRAVLLRYNYDLVRWPFGGARHRHLICSAWESATLYLRIPSAICTHTPVSVFFVLSELSVSEKCDAASH